MCNPRWLTMNDIISYLHYHWFVNELKFDEIDRNRYVYTDVIKGESLLHKFDPSVVLLEEMII